MDRRMDEFSSELYSGSESIKYSNRVILSRRQKKKLARQRRENQDQDGIPANNMSKSGAKGLRSVDSGHGKINGQIITSAPALRLHSEMNITNRILTIFLSHYIISSDQLLRLGYPVESRVHPGKAVIYNDPTVYKLFQRGKTSSRLNVNATEFVPLWATENCQQESHGIITRRSTSNIMENEHRLLEKAVNETEGNQNSDKFSGNRGVAAFLCDKKLSYERYDGGRREGNSRPRRGWTVKFQGVTKKDSKSSNGTLKSEGEDQQLSDTREKKCARCGRGFYLTVEGKYATQEKCIHHWGKIEKAVAPQLPQPRKVGVVGPVRTIRRYSCCGGNPSSGGCSVGELHVWNGVGPGVNDPLDGYVQTRVCKTFPPDGNFGIYAVDCEMCYTARGTELIRVTVVASDGHLVYDRLVKPESDIIDYNTRFSGITARDLNENDTKSLRDVQNDLMGFINADTILVGHGLENDLRALRIIHGSVVDTSVIFPHSNGLPYRRSLKSLVSEFLERDIQQDSSGHCSFEDARACMELMLWRIRTDFNYIFQSGVQNLLQLQNKSECICC
ncbi:uncharacterized protein LOC111865026 [Cryptotermes secundus]|uniref:uncharacterized protein LOC111865026 n=1 Tax=Cryptotermes secundus TaxID=105785 RepID=UPI001454D5BC|nr:uncharacterized protein LOC111865026 [Cryptotermes secundus]